MIRVVRPDGKAHQAVNSSMITSAVLNMNQSKKKIKIAYLSNGKPNVHELFSYLDQQVLDQFPEYMTQDSFEMRFFDKKNPAKPAPPDILTAIKNYADLAIIGSAD